MTVNKWGIAGLLLFFGDVLVSRYSFWLHDSGKAPLFSTTTNYEQAVVACFGAVVCGIMAMRRGSKGWLVLVLLAAWGMVVNFLGEL